MNSYLLGPDNIFGRPKRERRDGGTLGANGINVDFEATSPKLCVVPGDCLAETAKYYHFLNARSPPPPRQTLNGLDTRPTM